ncbi:MAG: S-layer protein, partial [Bacteroidales bacterium]|nr:S-layer protein [Bacteroidales bacterium]
MRRFTVILSLVLLVFACSKPDPGYKWDDDWDDQDPTPTPVVPDDPDDGIVGKPRYVWIDAAANFDDYANSRDKIREDCLKIAQTGFTDIIVDVRPTTGDVLFSSKVAPALKRIDRWKGSSYEWATRTADFDYLQAFIEEGHAAGLRVNAA